jgi:hypothetical protein
MDETNFPTFSEAKIFFLVFFYHLYNKFTCHVFVLKLKVKRVKRGQSVRPSDHPLVDQ